MDVHKRIDRIIMHPIIGPIVSILILMILFAAIFTINTSFPFIDISSSSHVGSSGGYRFDPKDSC